MKWAAVVVASFLLLASCSANESTPRLADSDLPSFIGLDDEEATDRIPAGVAASSVDLSEDLSIAEEPQEVDWGASTVVAVCFSSELLKGDRQQVAFGVIPTEEVTPTIRETAKAGGYARFIDGCDGVGPSERSPDQVRQQQEEQREQARDELADEVDRRATNVERRAAE